MWGDEDLDGANKDGEGEDDWAKAVMKHLTEGVGSAAGGSK